MADSDKTLKLAVDIDVAGNEKLHQAIQLIGKATTPDWARPWPPRSKGPLESPPPLSSPLTPSRKASGKPTKNWTSLRAQEIAEHLAKINAVRDAWVRSKPNSGIP